MALCIKTENGWRPIVCNAVPMPPTTDDAAARSMSVKAEIAKRWWQRIMAEEHARARAGDARAKTFVARIEQIEAA